MTPVSRLIEIALAVSGIVILYFMARIFVSKHAWGDGAQYEMLDLPTPASEDFGMLDGPAPREGAGDAANEADGAAVSPRPAGASVAASGARASGAASGAYAIVGADAVDSRSGSEIGDFRSDHSPDSEGDAAAEQGLVGLEDRIVRIGFTIALSYLSITWFGLRSVAMWLLIGPVLYLIGTALAGRDPIYKWLGLTTQFD